MRLSVALEAYLQKKRANGLRYLSEEGLLSAFQRFVSDLPLDEITPEQVLDFLNRGQVSNVVRFNKLRRFQMFFDFLTDRGFMPSLVIPGPRRVEDERPCPFVYTRTDVRNLIQAVRGNQYNSSCVVTEATLRTILLTLYGTGALPAEIFWLKRHDLDLKRRLIFLRGDRIVAPRKVPLSRDLCALLGSYLRSPERRRVVSSNIFVSKLGRPIGRDSMWTSFRRLCMRSGVFRVDGSKLNPRMRDLRQTFAVHRIASWIEQGSDLNRMLPALSAYMGMGGVASAERFLLITPERFKKELNSLSPRKPRRHWRDDAELMKFLASI